MDDRQMRRTIESVLRDLEVEQLERRVAPVKCEKNPDAPECRAVSLYGIAPEYCVDCGTPDGP